MTTKPNFEYLLENSIAAALSAIEIYNKPDFKYRNEIFVILIVNAWELLLKAKILVDNNDDLTSIYVVLDRTAGTFKLNRSGTPMTVEIMGALRILAINNTIHDNITSLIEIRDTATHFVNKEPISYLVYSLGVACLKNYHRLIHEWFNRDLLEYSFYILPIGFIQHFQKFSLLDFDAEEENIKRMLSNILVSQGKEPENGFHFNCEIEVNLVSAKNFTGNTDLVVGVDPANREVVTVFKPQNLVERYPLSYTELRTKAFEQMNPVVARKYFTAFMSLLRKDKKFAAYNFRTRQFELEFEKTGIIPNGTPTIYNPDCLQYVIAEYPKYALNRAAQE